MTPRIPTTTACLTALVLAACATPGPAPSSSPRVAAESRSAALAGYLPAAAVPDSLKLLPAPPAADSAAFANDEAIRRSAAALKGTPRWSQATVDADLSFPAAPVAFACALGAPIDPAVTPALVRLMQRSMIDAGTSTSAAKKHYARPRPFVVHGEGTCTPDWETPMRNDGSYPSGHNALGWAWALILAEIAPDRADLLLARGRTYGESRLVCNAHWQSDILEGRHMGAATVARLHADAAFRDDLAAAAKEVAAARTRGLAPNRDCVAEAAALSPAIPGAL